MDHRTTVAPGESSVITEPSMTWRPIETRPHRDLNSTYLIANAKGQVAPVIRGIIHNNVGSTWDWDYGEAATHWMPLPAPPTGAP